MSDMDADAYKRDADFFTAMWQSLCAEASRDVAHDERRNSTRFPFCSVQLAASLDGDAVPPIEAFEAVCCLDISRGGISYYWPHEPDQQKVVLMIQANQLRFCIEGHIMHCRPVYRNGEIQHIVGCQFKRRVDL